jgi:hypothetical protein
MEDKSYMKKLLKKSHIQRVNLERRITIGCFSQVIDAQMAKTKVESEGIECFIVDERIVSKDWLYPCIIGSVKLQVNEPDGGRAIEILHQTDFMKKDV